MDVKKIVVTLLEGRNLFRETLQPLGPLREADLYFKMLLEHHFDWDASFLGLHPHHTLTSAEFSVLEKALIELKQKRPIQQILQWAWFRDLRLKVSPEVLIPRPETEELVDWVLEDHRGVTQTQSILDVGTGSGCVAIALAKEQRQFHVAALDVSEQALSIAKQNTTACNAQVELFHHDILTKPLQHTYDIIVSNPPYIGWDEKDKMEKKVLDYEPHIALFAPMEDPLLFYKVILSQAKEALHSKGRIYFEINPIYLEKLSLLIKSTAMFKMSIRKDIFGKVRFMRLLKI